MSDNTTKRVGLGTAYGFAKAGGYEGTVAEFTELLGNIAIDLARIENLSVTVNTLPAGSQATASLNGSVLSLGIPKGDKGDKGNTGETGAPAGFGTVSATVDDTIGTPSVEVTASGADTAKNFAFAFHNLKGQKGDKGDTGEVSEAQLEETLADYAKTDGYYEEMTVGDAEQLVASQFVEDSEPYLYRTTGGSADVGNREYLDKIVGGTVAWNQLVDDGNFTDASAWIKNNATMTVSNNIGTVTQNSSGGYVNKRVYTVSGHRCLAMLDIKGVAGKTYSFNDVLANLVADGTWQTRTRIFTASAANTYFVISQRGEDGFPAEWQIKNACIFDLTAMFGTTIADYIYSLEQANSGAGVAWFKKLFPKPYYEYNAGELISVSGLESHDTVGFNQWDEEWEVGAYNGNTGEKVSQSGRIRSKNLIPVFPNTRYYAKGSLLSIYFYDASGQFIDYTNVTDKTFVTRPQAAYITFNTYVDYGSTYKNDICFNLSWSGWRNGEYESYEKHSYPLDNSLTLRGIPKLDASNNLYYDGDEYASDGSVNRKYGVVDLGTLSWGAQGTENCFYTTGIASVAKAPTDGNKPNLICDGYTYHYIGYGQLANKEYRIDGNANSLYIGIKNTACSTPAEMKSALSGVYLIYELATPTEETAEPYSEVQICADFGTEEFVSTSIVPVGHKTRYPANLRDKLQHLPDLADADGAYLIRQTNNQMSLEVFRIPKAPTTDGTYVLKATVSGGTPTYTWESEE